MTSLMRTIRSWFRPSAQESTPPEPPTEQAAPDAWCLYYLIADTWFFSGFYFDPHQAICAIVFERGIALMSTLEDDGSFIVRSCEDDTVVACVRRGPAS